MSEGAPPELLGTPTSGTWDRCFTAIRSTRNPPSPASKIRTSLSSIRSARTSAAKRFFPSSAASWCRGEGVKERRARESRMRKLTAEQELIVSTVRRFVEKDVIPVASELEHRNEYP